MRKNIEIKARTDNHLKIQQILEALDADYKGLDHQIDTYFIVKHGRLKLREGTIENNLIFYQRENISGPKTSNFLLYKSLEPELLKKILGDALDVLVVVDKQRHIYYVQNAKIHLDQVKDLGTFLEIEIVDMGEKNDPSFPDLHHQCEHYKSLFSVQDQDLIEGSYSDMKLKN